LKNEIKKIKDFWNKLDWWKRIILFIFLAVLIFGIWKLIDKPYYMKDGLCYSDFLENCQEKKVEVEGKIVKGEFCPGRESNIYILCDTNIPSCKPRYKTYPYDCYYGIDYDNCLSLFQPCWREDDHKIINANVENLLSSPSNKHVKMRGNIFIKRTGTYAKVSGVVGIIPESITVIE